MNGPHDLGGMQCFGRVIKEENEPVFHDDWEKRVFALTMSSFGVMGSIDSFRHAVERMPPEDYWRTTYYEHWLAALEIRLAELNFKNADKFESPITASDVEEVVPTGGNYLRKESLIDRKFALGTKVKTRNNSPIGHTRLPRYVRGKVGEIARVYGNFVLPDTTAHDLGECPEPLYSIRFGSEELWGMDSHKNDFLYIDLWHSYLEPI